MPSIRRPSSRVRAATAAAATAGAVIAFAALGPALSTARAQDDAGNPPASRDQRLRDIRAMTEEEREELILRLEARILELERQLAEARAEALALQRQLRRGGGGDAATGEGLPENLRIPPDAPFASPDAMLARLQTEYDEAFAEADLSTRRGEVEYFRNARGWTTRVTRKYTDRVEWLVEVREIEPLDRNTGAVTLVVHDPESEMVWSRPFRMRIPGRLLERDIAEGGMAVLRGVFRARPEIDQQREEPGMVNDPPLLGPYIEFGWEFEPRSMSPYVEPDRGRTDDDS